MSKRIMLNFLIVALWSGCLIGQEIKGVSIDEVHSTIQDSIDVVLLDVRSESEFDGPLGHIPGSVLIPLSELKDRLTELDSYKENQIIVICRSGNRSRMATGILTENGFNAVNMEGGMLAWNKKFINEKEVE